MQSPQRRVPENFEMLDEVMVDIYRSKTPAQRLRIASDMYAGARRLLLSHLRHEHPDWEQQRIEREAARRLSHGAV